jgi:dihydrofolate reductase
MILVHVAMSLDGFIPGPGHDMSWTGGAEYDTSSELADEVARTTGVVLAGRGWYEVASADEGGAVAGIYGGACARADRPPALRARAARRR